VFSGKKAVERGMGKAMGYRLQAIGIENRKAESGKKLTTYNGRVASKCHTGSPERD